MQVELEFGILIPGESSPVVDDPEDGEDQGTDEEDRGQDDDQQVLEPGTTAPGIL